jgi:hypothetical protein
MEALRERRPGIRFDIFTAVPEWFFTQSIGDPFGYHCVVSDVGLIQTNPLEEDLAATVRALERFWAGAERKVDEIISLLAERTPEAVICDISPLGLLLARRMGLPAVLIENFTWDWIYAAYREQESRLREFGERYAELVETVTRRIQLEPFCSPAAGAIRARPVSREPQSDRDAVRRALGLSGRDGRSLVLLTMGGMGWDRIGTEVAGEAETLFLVALGGGDELIRRGNLIRLPDRSPVYPPDLFWASDAVVGKLGYSTVADCYRSGARFAFIEREHFPESPVLAEFVEKNLCAAPIARRELETGDWIGHVRTLLERPRRPPTKENGATAVAECVLDLIA